MHRVPLDIVNTNPTFIGSWVMEHSSLCDDCIAYFEAHTAEHTRGVTGIGRDTRVKDRTDITIAPHEITLPGNDFLESYVESLHACYRDYLVQWPFLAQMGKKLEIGAFNLGRYQKGQHFQSVHTERSGIDSLQRVLAWMTYLNDVEEGGETHFTHYDLSIKPKKGLTIIWPAEWTHAHRGNVLFSGSKYMLTGWMSYCD